MYEQVFKFFKEKVKTHSQVQAQVNESKATDIANEYQFKENQNATKVKERQKVKSTNKVKRIKNKNIKNQEREM